MKRGIDDHIFRFHQQLSAFGNAIMHAGNPIPAPPQSVNDAARATERQQHRTAVRCLFRMRFAVACCGKKSLWHTKITTRQDLDRLLVLGISGLLDRLKPPDNTSSNTSISRLTLAATNLFLQISQVPLPIVHRYALSRN